MQHITSQKYIKITDQDLPLSCPNPNSSNWNLHPRVFLAIEDEVNKTIICPYCGIKYSLQTQIEN